MVKRYVWYSLFICIFYSLRITPLSAQKTDIRFDGQQAFNTISYLASDEFMGRRTNTPELSRLQNWIVNQYREWGLEAAGEDGNYFQTVPIPRKYANTYGIPKLIIDDREFYSRYDDFEIDIRSSADVAVSSDLCFVGYGISAPEKGFDEYAGLDVRGKIVFVLKGNPDAFIPPRPRLMDYDEEEDDDEPGTADSLANWDIESTDSTKMMTAYEKGAAAIIFYDPDYTPNPFRRFRQTVEKSPFEKDFIVVENVSEQVFHWIFWRDPQMTDQGFRTWFNDVRKDIKYKRSRSFNTTFEAELAGFESVLLRGEEFGADKGRNIIAKITGTDPELKNQYVIIGAHLDHIGVVNGQIYNGAEDNASGSAVVIELARLMKQSGIRTKRTVMFCLWTGEELGLFGSKHWVENSTDSVMMDRVAAYFNLDMVGIGDVISAPGALNFPVIWEVIKRDQGEDILSVVKPDTGELGGSDQTPFMELGIEALALMTESKGGHPDYHDTGDDSEKMNPAILQKTGQFVLQGVINVANETQVDLFIPDRELIFAGLYWPITVINPALKVKDSWTWLEAATSDDLAKLITDVVRDLKDDRRSDIGRLMRRRFGGTPRNRGVQDPAVFNHDLALVKIAKEALNFGRIDITGDDGAWFDRGITEKGTEVMGLITKNQICLHLIKPEVETLSAVLDKTRKPLLISGFQAFDDSMLALIKKKEILIAVDFDPANVDGCLDQLETCRTRLDTTANLVLNVVSSEGLIEAKQELYRKLIAKGWSKDEIYAMGGEGKSWRSNGNFDVLPGGRSRFSGR